MHPILQRQLHRLEITDAPPDPERWLMLLERVDRAYVEADQDRYTLERALSISSEEMRQRFDDLRATQRELVAASRKAGMADVATSVLHNVGNVLNSVNVSAGEVSRLAVSRSVEGLARAVLLLREQPQPGRFLDEDPRGAKLLEYLGVLDASLTRERAAMQDELAALRRHVEHIKVIVAQQLSVARGEHAPCDVREPVDLRALVDDALGTLRATLPAGADLVTRSPSNAVTAHTDRHKVFQIVMNLLSNARDAVAGRAGVVEVRLEARGERVALSVRDNGVGVAPEVRERIFTHGFTTKASGHGFGLHASACAAAELGGALTLHSEGVGQGATFTLTLPSEPRSPQSARGATA
ncbi:MAG: ATP-binding protein [Polyangiales bacterium]